ncbi:MAG: 5'/3'-nucleotidase SurE [Thermaerobacter sp.]|nr:5'/3'-nucleotidase SurE [Thermaerobacter sp.]
MHVLVTNDDGVTALGLRLLANILQSLGHGVTVVAPETNQSGKSQAITIDRPLWIKPAFLGGMPSSYAVRGTPADCVRLVLAGYFGALPDLVVSGVNHGLNLGPDIDISGTVGAARTAALRGIPSIAVSTDNVDGRQTGRLLGMHLPTLVDWAVNRPGVLYNVNFPSSGGDALDVAEALREWPDRMLALGRHGEYDQVALERDPVSDGISPASDYAAILHGRTAVTPMPVRGPSGVPEPLLLM